MQQQPVVFQFLYPLPDKSTTPAKHFTDLVITATAEIGREKELIAIQVNKMVYFDPSDPLRLGHHIHHFLWVVNQELYKEICEAAKQHAITKYKLKTPQQFSSNKKQLQ